MRPAHWLQENLGPRPQVSAGPAAETPGWASWSARPLTASAHPAPGGAPAGAGPVLPGCLRSPLTLPRVLHEVAGTWGSHRGSGWGGVLPRVGAWPSMGAAEGSEAKAAVGGSCLQPPSGGVHGQAGAQRRARRWAGGRAGWGGGCRALERGPTAAPSQLASVFALRTPPQTHPRTQACVHQAPDLERNHSKSAALCWGPSPSWASNPSPQPAPSSPLLSGRCPLPTTSGSAPTPPPQGSIAVDTRGLCSLEAR